MKRLNEASINDKVDINHKAKMQVLKDCIKVFSKLPLRIDYMVRKGDERDNPRSQPGPIADMLAADLDIERHNNEEICDLDFQPFQESPEAQLLTDAGIIDHQERTMMRRKRRRRRIVMKRHWSQNQWQFSNVIISTSQRSRRTETKMPWTI